MRIIGSLAGTDQISDTAIRALVRKRINDLGGEAFALAEVGYFLVVEIGDTLQALETQLGFSIVVNRITGIRWDQPDFTPSFEFIEDLGYCYDMVFVLDDSGFGVELFVPKEEGIDTDLLAMCRMFAVVNDGENTP
jgi:hypothetical protein